MRIDFTCRRFPVTGTLKQQCGLPFSCVIQPFAKAEGTDPSAERDLPPLEDVARCKKCFAYVNCYSTFTGTGWTCSLCGTTTAFKAYAQGRYQRSGEQLYQLPETKGFAYEASVGEPVVIETGSGGFSGPAPVYVALVDVGSSGPGGGSEFVELVRSSLEAALEALPPAALFGLITFSDKLCLHDLRSATPTSRVVPLLTASSSPSGTVQALMPLAEAMPLKGLLAPVAEFKQRITEALETLIPDPQPAGVQGQGLGSAPAPAAPMSRSGTTGAGAGPVPCRALGPALLAVLDYLKAVQRPPFQPPEGGGYGGPTAGPTAGGGMAAGAQALADLLPPAASPVHLLLFLSGPPDLGPGRVVNPKRLKPSPSAAVAEAGVVRGPPHTSHTSVGAGADALGAAAEQQLRQLSLQQQQQQQGGGYSEAGGSYYEPSPETNRFYQGAAVAAAALGVCVDVYAVSPGLVGLPALEPLANSTGGAMYLYPSAEDSALPQDVYRRLSCPRATAGMLRVRASHGFKPVRYYGRLFADSQFDNLHHIISCDASDTFAVDFEHTHKAMGFAADDVTIHPTLQVAFQYTTVVPISSTSTQSSTAAAATTSSSIPYGAAAAGPSPHGNGAGGGGSSFPAASAPAPAPGPTVHRMALVRRLRVVTLRLSVTRDAMDLYRHCSTDAVLCLLMHKVAKVTAGAGPPPPLPQAGPHTSTPPPHTNGAGGAPSASGRSGEAAGSAAEVEAPVPPQIAQARVLLRDWLVLLVAGYQRAKHPSMTVKQLAGQQPDLDFAEVPALQRLPRLVYALLRSPLLASPPEGQHPDLTSFMRHLWASLPPSELQAAVYPSLSSWLGTDTVGQQQHTLCRASLLAIPGHPQAPLFLLDAYIVVMVLYTAAAAGGAGGGGGPVPFPLPQASGLARAIGGIRQARRITPKVRYVREGTAEADLFFQLLLDEPELPGSPQGGPATGPAGPGQLGSQTDASSPSSTQYGLGQFLEHVRGEVLVHLASEAQ